jgi:hypothetical protein
LAVLAASLLVVTSASAVSPQRTFVASYGVDTNPCSLTASCRGFQAAIDAVAAGGEVVAFDSAGYGAMAIHKSVSVIVPPGVHAGLSPTTGIPLPGYPGQYGVVLIDIQNTDTVVLRGLNINHQGTVTGGIEWISGHGGTVQIENTVINGFPKEGIYVQAPSGVLSIDDSVIRNNGVGIYAALADGSPGGGIVGNRVRIERSTSAGVRLLDGVTGHLNNCTLTQNNLAFHLIAVSLPVSLYLDRSTVIDNNSSFNLEGSPVYIPALARLTLSSSTLLTDTGVKSGSTFVYSFGNNSAGILFDGSYPPH